MTRNVRWHEDRQERAAAAAARLRRRALKEFDRAIEFERQAAEHQLSARKAMRRGFHKKAAAETAKAETALSKSRAAMVRSQRLGEKATAVSQASGRYGRAKGRIGVYDSARGWSDRDARRRR